MGKSPDNELMDLLEAGDVTSIAVANTDVAYSQSFPNPKNRAFGLEIKFTSAGAVDVKVELEEGNQPPTTEGAADATWWVGDSISTGITDENPHGLEVSPIVAMYSRIKLTGQGSNPASVVCDLLKLVTSQNG